MINNKNQLLKVGYREKINLTSITIETESNCGLAIINDSGGNNCKKCIVDYCDVHYLIKSLQKIDKLWNELANDS